MADSASEIKSHTDPITLTRFILSEQSKHQEAQGDLTILLQSVQLACKVIANAMSKAGIANLYGVAGTENKSGDAQKKLDVFSDEAFVNALSFSEKIAVMVSEENERVIVVENCHNAKYCIAFDPLDGSSNIDANVSVGTIFGIYRRKSTEGPGKPEDILRRGQDLCASGYALYGAASMLVLTTGQGVHGFTLDPSIGEYILTHKDIRIPRAGKIYSINEGNWRDWDEPTRKFIQWCKDPPSGKPKSLRYIGSMVADVHRTLLYGGIFCYPGTKKAPKGKLRLLYECSPMAMLMEQAGGKATTGTKNVLDVDPSEIHERCPIFLGSAEDVEKVEEFYR